MVGVDQERESNELRSEKSVRLSASEESNPVPTTLAFCGPSFAVNHHRFFFSFSFLITFFFYNYYFILFYDDDDYIVLLARVGVCNN